ncbi:hypothetical protein XENOCAPTIV_027288 [Xenoophorus captivus]|uniref:Uncharacterized protein n=1 Tax=Xenoophorus captivus TaxID=1517983 RepID=A0ABV0RSY2_9TELE
MLFYCQNLSTVFSQVSQTVKAALPETATSTLQSFIPGDWILVRESRRKHWKPQVLKWPISDPTRHPGKLQESSSSSSFIWLPGHKSSSNWIIHGLKGVRTADHHKTKNCKLITGE